MKFCCSLLFSVRCLKSPIKILTLFLSSFAIVSCGTDSSSSDSAASTDSSANSNFSPSSQFSVPDITRIQLVDASDLSVLQTLTQNSTVDLNGLPPSFNFLVTSSNSSVTGSVGIEVSGCESSVRTENDAPYTAAEQSVDFSSLAVGDCTIVATPYQDENLAGDVGTPFTVDFTVVDTTEDTASEVDNASGDNTLGDNTSAVFMPDLVRIDLVDAAGLGVIQTLTEGATIDLNGLPTLFNFVVTSSDISSTGSVKIDTTGCVALDRHENSAPYTVAVEGVDLAVLETGDCTITARPYQSANVTGQSGDAYTVNFNVVDTTISAPVITSPLTPPAQDDVVVNDPIVSQPVEDNQEEEELVQEDPALPSDDEDMDTPVATGKVRPVITPSRVSCASPCTVVFSAENTTADNLDSHAVWSRLSYYWDFGTAADTGSNGRQLYKADYTYVSGDTRYESGHVPMVTKTFLCDVGECVYTVNMRATNEAGEVGDAQPQNIIVRAESAQWSAENTICVSNTLDTEDDWSTGYDKSCPEGATQQNTMPFADGYNDKLVLLKNGDKFIQNLATYNHQSNFKVGYFGDENERPPEIDGDVEIGVTNISSPTNAPPGANYNSISNASVSGSDAWPSNVYFEGLKLKNFYFPMSYKHVGIHDIDMDRSAYSTGGAINVVNGSDICYYGGIDCSLVPFPKGGYISSVNIVGFSGGNGGPGVNIVQTACAMVNYLGITDISVRRTREHNLRIAGWYRINIMRSLFRGEHELPGKSKITLRSCLRSGGTWEGGKWNGNPALASEWNDDIEGRTRADSASSNGSIVEFAHTSRYQVIAHNQLGDPSSPLGKEPGGLFYSSNTVEGDERLKQDVILSHNTFSTDSGQTSSGNVLEAYWGTCVGNTYSGVQRCSPFTLPNELGYQNEPTVIVPAAPSL